MRKRLRDKLSPGVVVADGSVGIYNSFDIVGDIAIIKLPSPSSENAREVADAILNCNRGVKTVLVQTSKVGGDYRLRRLTCVGGEDKTRTVHKEHGCTFAVDVEKCYFSPRLSGERLRVAKLVLPGEIVVNMFAGVGCFSILIAKRVPTAKVYSIDINPEAFGFMNENVVANGLVGRVFPLLGDAKAQIEIGLCGVADRVLMPLPEKAIEYLPCAVGALKSSGGWLHVHVFEHVGKTEVAVDKAKARIADALGSLGVAFEFGGAREVRSIGPN
ncbi:MAG TPA: class I SAM-dependent methyltransferase family protein, partial [Candidatus Nanoarchaeia archaeon]|nr:class I SAM-dependent methyltransferase family protein [Candidatus Nanoarchaeia archaeon]